MLPILAHGALGYWDELVFVGVIVVFVAMMGISWFRSRTIEPELDADAQALPEKPKNDADERFALD